VGDDPLSAYNRCWDLSVAFSWYCTGRGVMARTMRLESPLMPLCSPPEVLNLFQIDKKAMPDWTGLISHYVVFLEDSEWIVDWTAKQFWPELPCPWIVKLPDLKRYWASIDP
jgi:hypothetical protein